MAGYRDCLDYLNRMLRIGDTAIWADNEIHAVLGNHDVDRSRTKKDGSDLSSKFEVFVDLWKPFRKGVLPIEKFRHTEVKKNNCAIDLFSLNSCLGCGEWRSRLMPPGVPDELRDKLAPFMGASSGDPETYQRLDTPAFYEQDIDDIVRVIDGLRDESLAVMLGHHNILPQATPRIDLYTEVINGGLARARLSRCGRPVLYLHGHIHEDPVEVVIQPDVDGESAGRLISISAPAFSRGFNIVQVQYGRKKLPVGVVTHQYRLDAGGGVREHTCVRIPLFAQSEAADQNLADDVVQKVVAALPTSPTNFMRFRDVASKIPSHHHETVAQALLEAEWLGYVRIRNREKRFDAWQIARVTL